MTKYVIERVLNKEKGDRGYFKGTEPLYLSLSVDEKEVRKDESKLPSPFLS